MLSEARHKMGKDQAFLLIENGVGDLLMNLQHIHHLQPFKYNF